MTAVDRPPATQLRLASFPHFSYLPQFIAHSLGFFDDAGLDITLVRHSGPWSDLIEMAGDSVDIIIGNLWFALQDVRRPGALVPVAHCLQTTRFMLYRRAGSTSAPFAWQELEGASVIVSTDVPTPWIAFREALSVQGVSLDRVRVVVGYSGREAAEDLAHGAADFAVLDIDRAAMHGLEEAAVLADSVGLVPWSVYLADRDDLAARPEIFRAFRQAIERALIWVQEHDSESLANAVASWFPEVDLATSARIIERYRVLGAWPERGVLEPEHVAHWQEILVRAGALEAVVPAESLFSFIGPDAGASGA